MDRPQRCQRTTAATASTMPAAAPPAIAATGTQTSFALWPTAAGSDDTDELVGVLITVVVLSIGGPCAVTMDTVVIVVILESEC